MKKLFTPLALVFCSVQMLNAQCPTGEVEMELTISTDNFGSEGYWELVPGGNACGTGTIASGGNSSVGCNGGGAQNQPAGGYGNNQQIGAPAQCLTQGNTYTLYYVDDWGDGGFEFEVKINGYIVATYKGVGSGFSQTFTADEPPQFNVGVEGIDRPYDYEPIAALPIEATFFNYGKDPVNSVTLSYQIDNNPAVSATISGLTVPNFEEFTVTHPTTWTPSSFGSYSVSVWVTQINGNNDMDPGNDSIYKVVEIGPGIPNHIDAYLTGTPAVIQIGNSSDQLNRPTDLDFHPTLTRKELWIVNKRTENQGGSVTIYYDAGTPNQTDETKVDGNAWHFMSLPTGIAFAESGFFGTSPGVYDANHNGGQPFTGPSLWTSDPAIFAQPSGGNGSHMDMLHESPECQGIAHEKDNVYWVFDGFNSDIVRYDFVEDHGPGADDHSDGEIWRYSSVSVAKDPTDKVVSHLVYDKTTDWLYVVDYGNKRVFRMDTKTGTRGGTPTFGPFEPLADYVHIDNYTWEIVVDSGLVEPAGIDLIEDRMIVSDYSTGEIIIYDISSMPATELGRFATGAQGIMGIKIGPDGRIWYVDYDANTVNRVDAVGLSLNEAEKATVNLFPNPNNGEFVISGDELKDNTVEVYDSKGQLVLTQELDEDQNTLKLRDNASGLYLLKVIDAKRNLIGNSQFIVK